MSLAVISLVALIIVIVVSCISTRNIGVMALGVALVIGAAGPGPTVTAALMAPTVMLLAKELEMSPLLLAIMAGNGGHAGGMSPIAIGGIITTGLTAKLGLTDVSVVIWLNNVLVHFATSIIAFFVFGGMKLLRGQSSAESSVLANLKVDPLTREQTITIVGLAAYITGVIGFKMDIELGAFLVGMILIFLKVADEDKAIKAMPLGAILMVTGVTVMITLMTKVGGIDLFAGLIAKLSSTATITLVTGFVSGLISAYASTTGVVIPTFVPMAPILLQKVGASADQLLPLISAIVSCGFVVDMSPLSTSGAIYLANAHPSEDKSKLFKNMLIWGLAMSVIGAVIAWVAFSLLQIP